MSGVNADQKTLAKVRALLARAGHPNTPEEEARTSAVIAAKMIYSCGLEVNLKSQGKLPFDERQPKPKPKAPSKPKASSPYRIITTKFDGWCKSCGDPFDVNDVVAWVKDRGCTHYDCRDFWDDEL